MTRMNDPLMQLVRFVSGGGNPQTLLAQMAQQDPRMGQAIQMIQGKNAQQLRTMAENMARERGTSVEQVARQLGLTLPK